MAYKYQLGLANLSGSITQTDGALDVRASTVDSLDVTSGGITNAGAIAGATTIDASGDLTVLSITNAEFSVDASGNTDIDGTLNVEGVPTFQAAAVFSSGISAAGSIAGATNVSASALISGTTLDIDGGGANIAGAVSLGSTLMVATSISMGGVSIVETELGYLDGVTAGTAALNKAMVLDGSLDISGGRNLTISGELDAATGDFSGIIDVAGVATLASAVITAGATFGGGTGAAGVTISTDGAISADAIIKTESTVDASNSTDGSLQTDGGLSVAKKIFNNTDVTLAAVSGVVTMGATTAATVSAAGIVNVNNATDATTATDGSLQTDGGLSVVKNAYVGADLTVAGDLIVQGTTVTLDVATVGITGSFSFEGATADDFETTLGVIDPTADRAINLANVAGTLIPFAAASTTAIAANPAELNLLDAGVAIAAEVNDLANADGIIVEDGDVMKKVALSSIKTYIEGNANISAQGFNASSYGTGSAAQSLAATTGVWYPNSETLASDNPVTLHLSGSWTVGDSLIIKAPSNATPSNSLTILPLDSGDEASGHMIDGDQSGVVLSSPYAAVNMIFAGNGSWLIY
tara:strand:+ start:6499 stop:8244 length:1746 start_codon:yes stop_codon:yes gene_type:complete